ncbi:MAG: PAS domain-containing protein, partial [Chloroflexi bacterium]
MSFQTTPEVVLSITALALCLAISLYAIQRRQFPIGRRLVYIAITATFWLLTSTLEVASVSLEAKIFWGKLQYLSIGFLPIFWFLLAVEYTGQGRFLLPREKWLFIWPLILQAVAWTNEWHYLLWRTVVPHYVNNFVYANFIKGPIFWVNVTYAYLLLAVGTWLFIRFSLRASQIFRGQTALLVAAAVIPWVGNAFYMSGLGPMPFLDLTPIAFGLSTICLVIALTQYQFVKLAPVDPLSILDSLSDGVIVLDHSDRITSLNAQAGAMIGIAASVGVGRPVNELLPGLLDRVECVFTSYMLHPDRLTDRKILEVREVPLQTAQNTAGGRVLILRDITEQELSAQNLRNSQAK